MPSNSSTSSKSTLNDGNSFLIILLPSFIIVLGIILTFLNILNIILFVSFGCISIIVSCTLFLIDKYDRNIKKYQPELKEITDLKSKEVLAKINSEKLTSEEKAESIRALRSLNRFNFMIIDENLNFKKAVKFLGVSTIFFIGLVSLLYYLFANINSIFPKFYVLFFIVLFVTISSTICAIFAIIADSSIAQLSMTDTVTERYRVEKLDLVKLVLEHVK